MPCTLFAHIEPLGNAAKRLSSSSEADHNTGAPSSQMDMRDLGQSCDNYSQHAVERGWHMERPLSCCDFCGDCQCLREYPTDHSAVNWYACGNCARLVDAENWERLIERSLAAYGRIRAIPDGEEPILRQHVEQLVQAFRSFRLVAV
jgi:hypothetical protein